MVRPLRHILTDLQTLASVLQETGGQAFFFAGRKLKTLLGRDTMRRNLILAASLVLGLTANAQAEIGPAEKPDLKLGFIKLTDMAPLAVAWEQGFFMDEGLFVELEAQANWKVLLDRVITGDDRTQGHHATVLRHRCNGRLSNACTHYFGTAE